MKHLYPPQVVSRDSLLRSLRNYHCGLDSSSTGTGKTVKAVEIARFLGVPPVTVCPKAVIPTWERTFKEQGVPFLAVTNYEKLRTGRTNLGFWNGRQFEWGLQGPGLIIWDEVHKTQGAFTKNSRMLISAKAQGHLNLMLSATAAEDPTELRAIGYVLGLHDLKNFGRWALAHGCHLNPWGKLTFTSSSSKAESFLRLLHDEIYPEKGHKLTRHDLAEFFKDTHIITEPLDFGDELQSIYANMATEVSVLLQHMKEDEERAGAGRVNVLTEQLRARQKVELLKVPVMLDMTKDALAEHNSVAIFVNFDATIEALGSRLGVPYVVIRDQSARERQEAIDSFQSNRVHIIICNVAAGGQSISLHDELGQRPRIALVSPSWNAKDIVQVLGRIDRAGSQSETVQRVLFAAGTIEEDVEKSLRKKLLNLDTLHAPVHHMHSSYNIRQDMNTTPGAEPRPHAKHSPSSLKYKEICPGYSNRQSESVASKKGTRIHEACEKDDMSLCANDEERLIAEKLLAGVEKILKLHGWDKDSIQDYKEVRLDIKTGAHETFGTCDRLMVRGNQAAMIDYKTGWFPIDDPSINVQTQAYVLGAFQKFNSLNEIDFYFIVPMRDQIMFAHYTREDMPSLALRIGTIIERAETTQEDALNPQPEACEFCARQGTCKALANKILVIGREYAEDGMALPDDIHSTGIETAEQAGHMLKTARVLREAVNAWADGINYRVKQMAFDEGLEIPGFSKQFINRAPSVLSTLGAWETVKNEFSLEDFLTCSDLNLTRLKELASSRAKRGQKGRAAEMLVATLKDAGVLAEGGTDQQLRIQRN